ncbi:MAG: hypothetical protein KA113_05110 [Syntrophaceae bacterium]|nr:hypothetical protein [Syntrophaceae bacterium]
MPAVADVLHPVVQTAHLQGGFDVDRVLLLNFMRLVSGDKTEKPHVLMQVFQGKFMLLLFLQVVETHAGEVGNDDILGKIAFLESGKVTERLIVSFVEVFAARLVLDDQYALPEEVDVAVLISELSDRFFKAGDALAGDAEYVEKTVPEGFGFRFFGAFPFPFLGKSQGARFDFIPAQRHIIIRSFFLFCRINRL